MYKNGGLQRPRSFITINNVWSIRKILHNELYLGLIILLIFIVLLMSSCAGKNAISSETFQSFQANLKSERLNTELSEKVVEFRKTFAVADYKVGPEDLLDIEVFRVPELKTSVRVSATGFIQFPLIGKIEVSGRTVAEIESDLSERLKKYITEPAVTIFVKEYRSQPISVLGSVKNPNIFYVTGQKYLLDMISLAGGLTPEAGDVCIVQRSIGSNTDKPLIEKIVIDMSELLVNGRSELNIPLLAGDVIHVPKSGIFFIDGAVHSPGSYQIKGKTTLVQALSMAKGLDYVASTSDIRIFRDNGKSERDVILVDYDAILSGRGQDIEIKDKDIIIVSKSGVKSFFKGLATSLNFGIFSLGKGF